MEQGSIPPEIDYRALFVKRCVLMASAGLLYYDYCLTFAREVNWILPSVRRRWTVIHFIFYLNRYIPLVGQIPILARYYLPAANPPSTVCGQLQHAKNVVSFSIHVMAAVFSVLRVYGLYDRNRRVLFGLSAVLILAMAAALALLFVNYEDAVDPDALVDNCLRNVSKAWGVRLALMYTFLLGFDVLVFSMTLRRSLQHAQWGSTPLIRVVIRDGTMSFGVISVICLAVILSFAISSPVSRGREIVLASNLSSILVNRMILNLRDPSLLSTREVQSSGIWAQRDGIPTYRTGGDIITTMHTDHSDEEEDMAISSQGCYTPESQYEHRAICAKLHQGDMRGSV